MIWDLLKFYLFKETSISLLTGSGKAVHGQTAAPGINQFFLMTSILQRGRVTINHYLLLLHDEIVIMGGKCHVALSHLSSQSPTLKWHLSAKFFAEVHKPTLPSQEHLPPGSTQEGNQAERR